ncbi:MOSC domain-containing protein [Massilia sp. TS11]|uniref:MOSC domain-containing protein n=1 Tax=Massilia sp. TS11 TaxID=2908003 RepID=UPI001EDB617E|nr:MOSC N-terminal beta barrel domain-containing protein [Massilia sp. TS11]MCG2584944.1 MOSC N-terminal beta barrel domain-containing protein [Massilia sp. TS11]
MPTISQLTIYPIKSCAGIDVPAATLTRAGLAVDAVYDREWMLVDAAGQFLSQRECPRMALITPRLKTETLELRAPGMLRLEIPLGMPEPGSVATRRVRVWDDEVLATDCDDLTAAWFSRFLGRDCRLVRFHADAERQASATWTGGADAPTLFADGYPLLVIGAASLADLNTRLSAAGRAPLPMNRFRPNIVLADLAPYEEDYVAAFQFGETALRPVKPCPRCPIPSIDQASGVPGPDPLDILQSYRRKAQLDDAVCFGMNAIVSGPEGMQLHIGQSCEIELAFD